jgi:hypothetical protein
MKILRTQTATPYGYPASGFRQDENKTSYGKVGELSEELEKYAPRRKKHVLVELLEQHTGEIKEKLLGAEPAVAQTKLNQVGGKLNNKI